MHKLFSSLKALKVGALTLPLLLAACSNATFFHEVKGDSPRYDNEFSEFEFDYGNGRGQASVATPKKGNRVPSYYEQVEYPFPVATTLNPRDAATIQRVNQNAREVIFFRQQTPAQFLELCHYAADLFEDNLKGKNWSRPNWDLDALVKRFNYGETHSKFRTLTRKVREGILVRGWNNMKQPPSAQLLVSQGPLALQLTNKAQWSTLEPYQVKENFSSFAVPGTNNKLFFSIQTPHGRRDFDALLLLKAYRYYNADGSYNTCVMNLKAHFSR